MEQFTPREALSYGYALEENGWKDGYDRNWLFLDFLLRPTILDQLTTPPGSPAEGDAYLVTPTATGDWATHEEELAVWRVGLAVWVFHPPLAGARVYDANLDDFLYYDGAAWGLEPSGGGGGITDAPNDGSYNVRRNLAWEDIGPDLSAMVSDIAAAASDATDALADAATALAAAAAAAAAVAALVFPIDVGLAMPGVPANSLTVSIPMNRAIVIPVGLTNSHATAEVAATASTVITLKKNGTSFGTATFAAAGTVATMASAGGATFAAGDILTFAFPAVADATLAGIGVNLAGTR